MIRALRIAVAGGAASFIAVVACSVDVDLTGKTCPCPSGLLCDTATNQCVTTLPAATSQVADSDGAAPATPPTAPPPAACADASCKCEADQDCSDPMRRFCGPAKTCVECKAAPSDTCTAGGYCNDKSQCSVGCKAEGDCTGGQHCQVASHRCVDCRSDDDCAGGSKKCSPSGRCVDTCTVAGVPCGGGTGTCCGGFCLSFSDDVLNCGRCGNACSDVNGTPSCSAGSCKWACVDGYAHCRGPLENSGCETSVRSVDSCGGCNAACSPAQILFADGIACAATGCTYGACQQGHYDRDGDPKNGCEAPCGGKNQTCCPTGRRCNDGSNCRGNGACPPN